MMRRRGRPLVARRRPPPPWLPGPLALSATINSRSTQAKRRLHSSSKIWLISRAWLTRRLSNNNAPPPPQYAPRLRRRPRPRLAGLT